MPGFAAKVSFKMLCPQSCGSLGSFQFLTIKNASAGKASVILLYKNKQATELTTDTLILGADVKVYQQVREKFGA